MTTTVVVNQKNETGVAAKARRGRGEDCRVLMFGTLLKPHAAPSESCFPTPNEDEADRNGYSQILAVIAHPNGIHGVYSYRELFSFDKFRGIGSGRKFAPAAMFAGAERARSTQSAARIGARAGCEFDKRSVLPLRVSSCPTVIATEIKKADA